MLYRIIISPDLFGRHAAGDGQEFSNGRLMRNAVGQNLIVHAATGSGME